jgi:hypothetical protein
MKKIKVSDIANAAIRTAAEQRKLTSAFLVGTDSPDFAAVKARILRPTPLVKDLISQLRNTPGKSIVKFKVGDTEVPLTNVVIVGNTIVLS